jgi:2-desacetyl-2-hydroxyethyl bacteriochlorophyllide A dehydrogenase
MKAMVVERFGEPMEYREVETPSIGDRDVLLSVRACGLSGTDIKIYDGKVPTIKAPIIMGHEIAGVVEEVGKNVKDFHPGDHGVVHIYLTCGTCFYCRNARENDCQNLEGGRIGFEVNGGYAEYLRVPERNLFKISPNVPFEVAAIIPGPVAAPLHAVRNQGRVRMGETAVIVGAGGLGIHAVQLAVAMGARVIAVDIDDEKLQAAESFGAEEVINAEKADFVSAIRDLTGGLGADMILEVMRGPKIPEVLDLSVQALRLGGRLVILGYEHGQRFPMDITKVFYDEIEILGSRSYTRQDLIDAISLVERGKVKPLFSQKVPLKEANEALKRVRKSEVLGRIVLVI